MATIYIKYLEPHNTTQHGTMLMYAVVSARVAIVVSKAITFPWARDRKGSPNKDRLPRPKSS